MSQRSRVLPWFGLSLGFTLAYVSFIVLIPLSAVFIKSFGIGWDGLWEILTSERILKSLQLSFSAALIAATVNVIFGLLLAWCLVRYSFPGKRIVDALVDLFLLRYQLRLQVLPSPHCMQKMAGLDNILNL